MSTNLCATGGRTSRTTRCAPGPHAARRDRAASHVVGAAGLADLDVRELRAKAEPVIRPARGPLYWRDTRGTRRDRLVGVRRGLRPGHGGAGHFAGHGRP